MTAIASPADDHSARGENGPTVAAASQFRFPWPLQPAGTGNGKQPSLTAGWRLAGACIRSHPLASHSLVRPRGAFFRPGRLIQKPARAAASRMAGTLTSPLAPPLPGHALTAASTTAPSCGTGAQDHHQARCPSIGVLASTSKYVILLTRLLRAGVPSSPIRLDLADAPHPRRHNTHRLVETSRMRFGRPRAEVEARISRFLGVN